MSNHIFVAIPRDQLYDENFQSLSSNAFRLYVYMRAKYNYKTLSEGTVTITFKEMSKMMSVNAMIKARAELILKGFIDQVGKTAKCHACVYTFCGKYKDFMTKRNKKIYKLTNCGK